MGFLVACHAAFAAEPFFLFDLDYGRCDGAVVAVLVPGRVAAVAEDDLVAGGGVPAPAVYADGGFAGFAAFEAGGLGGGGGCERDEGGGLFGGGGGRGGVEG